LFFILQRTNLKRLFLLILVLMMKFIEKMK
jgi:hypothetical protein